MIKRLLLLLLVCHLSLAAVVAQMIPDFRFRRLSTRDGLTSSQVNYILRDSRGYVWMATPFGLNRYDGYRVKSYFSFVRDTLSLRTNRIDKLQEDGEGRIWIDHGLSFSVFNPVTEKTERHPEVVLTKLGIKGSLEEIFVDSKKNLWVKTFDNGFYIYNAETKKVKHMNFGYTDNEFPKEYGVNTFCETKEGMLMVSTLGDLMLLDGEKGLIKWREDFIHRHSGDTKDYEVYDPDDGYIWVVTSSSITYAYNKLSQRWYTSLPELMRDQGFENVPEEVVVWELRYDRKGNLWVATDHQGAFVLNFKSHQWRQFTYNKGDDTSLPDHTLRCLYEDQLGRMWLSTYKNGVALSSDAMSNFASLPVGDVNAICEDKQGYFWLGMNSGGIKKIDPETFEVLEEYNKATIPVQNDVVVSSYCAKDGTLWFGTWEGGAISYRNGVWKNYLSTDPGSKMMTNNVWGISEDRWGNIWLGMLGGGAVRIDRKTGAQRVFNEQNSPLKTVWTNSLNTTPLGWLLLGNSEYCALIHPGTMKVINLKAPEDENSFTTASATQQIIMDSYGLIWQGSASGLNIYDRKTGFTKTLDMKSGFYGSNVVAVTEGENHTIWVVTEHGVSMVTPQRDEQTGQWTFAVRSFNEQDGLQPGPFNQRAICYTSKGLVLVGSQDGLDVINTRHLNMEKYQEKPIFSGLLIFDEEVEVGDKIGGSVVLPEALDICRSISLDYNEQFTIQLGSTSGLIRNGKRFVYRLEGFNDNWVKTADNNPNITYNSLSPGSYTLVVRMLNDDGTIGEKESRLAISIRAPFYRSFWAILFYIAVVAGALLLWRRRFLQTHTILPKTVDSEKSAVSSEEEAVTTDRSETAEPESADNEEPIADAVLMDDEDNAN
ncbi:MAG: hypothetical protein K5764_04050 [Prevotella sp.]|nr:hypothetical protein [Prevotella sp.]